MTDADSCSDKEALAFIKTDKFKLLRYMQIAHIVAIASEFGSAWFKQQRRPVLANLLILLKVFVFFFAVFATQTGILFKNCRSIVENS